MKNWETKIQRMSIPDEADRVAFLRALRRVEQDLALSALLQLDIIPLLFRLFQRLQAEQSPLRLILGQSQEDMLWQYFHVFTSKGAILPKGGIARKTLVHLAAAGLSQEAQEQMLDIGLLDFLSADQLQRFPRVRLGNIYTMIAFFKADGTQLPKEVLALGIELILLATPDFITAQSADLLGRFLREALPRFEARFAHRMEAPSLHQHPDRLLTWWKVWQRHTQREEELPPEDQYYQTDFATIIQYVPEFIWWNNGLLYARGHRVYHFESREFRHLAVGGSVRKGPDFRPYTRRMAKAFVILPYDFPAGQRDMYLYFYGFSLGAGELLLSMLPHFMRHRGNRIQLLAELALWNPVLQKLAGDAFERLDAQEARGLMGYLYHCLRDQPGYQVKSRTVAQLCRDSRAYNDRIQARARVRREREAERRTNRRVTSWKPHTSILPMEVRGPDRHYKIIELTDELQLDREGSVMNHCVGSYVGRCTHEDISIWSLRENRNGTWYSLVTIEVECSQIVQARGPFNTVPIPEHRKLIRVWRQRENMF